MGTAVAERCAESRAMGKGRNSRGGWVSIAGRRAAQRKEKPRKNKPRREESQRREQKASETETANCELLRVVEPRRCECSAPARSHHISSLRK